MPSANQQLPKIEPTVNPAAYAPDEVPCTLRTHAVCCYHTFWAAGGTDEEIDAWYKKRGKMRPRPDVATKPRYGNWKPRLGR